MGKYSNEEYDDSLAWFWENFDKENYSIWHCEYMYPEDLTLVFMSNNLIGGFYQRLDRLRKHGFGAVAVFGENNKSDIAGVWCWRGQGLAFELSEDLQVDYGSYKWTKLDFDAPESRKHFQVNTQLFKFDKNLKYFQPSPPPLELYFEC